MGGYQPVTDQDEQSSIKRDLAPLTFQEFASNHNVTGCVANTVTPTGYNITKACKQVLLPTHSASKSLGLSLPICMYEVELQDVDQRLLNFLDTGPLQAMEQH